MPHSFVRRVHRVCRRLATSAPHDSGAVCQTLPGKPLLHPRDRIHRVPAPRVLRTIGDSCDRNATSKWHHGVQLHWGSSDDSSANLHAEKTDATGPPWALSNRGAASRASFAQHYFWWSRELRVFLASVPVATRQALRRPPPAQQRSFRPPPVRRASRISN